MRIIHPALSSSEDCCERPDAIFLDGRNLSNVSNFGYEEENNSTYIINDVVDYDADNKKSFIELYIDDRFPTELAYGNGVVNSSQYQVLPALGNRILIPDPVPGSTWAFLEPTTKKRFLHRSKWPVCIWKLRSWNV